VNPISQQRIAVNTLTDKQLTQYQEAHLKFYPETMTHYKEFNNGDYYNQRQHQHAIATTSMFYKWRGVLPKQRYIEPSAWDLIRDLNLYENDLIYLHQQS
jgi:hypothetical protein